MTYFLLYSGVFLIWVVYVGLAILDKMTPEDKEALERRGNNSKKFIVGSAYVVSQIKKGYKDAQKSRRR